MDLNDAPAQSTEEEISDRQPLFLLANNDVAPIRARDLVHGVIRPSSTVLVYGAPKTGKSFATLDLAFSIARGVKWFGYKTDQKSVLIVAGEGDKQSQIEREVAYRRHNNIESETMSVATIFHTDPINADGGIPQIEDAVTKLRGITNKEVGAIVIDTLSSVTPGMDENAHESMSRIIQIINGLSRRTKATVILVHHTAKAGEIERGHSSLRGAVDTVLGVRKGENHNEIYVDAQRGLAQGQIMPFDLETIMVGKNVDGLDISSCYIQPVEGGAQTAGGRKLPKGKNQRKALTLLENMCKDTGEYFNPPDGNNGYSVLAITLDEWRDRALEGVFDKRASFDSAKDGLFSAGHIDIQQSKVWIRGTENETTGD